MMPIIAHHLFDNMQIMMNSIRVFTEKCVLGIQANRSRAEGWLEKNAMIVTALNPLIGYATSAELVKEALATDRTIRQVATEKALKGELHHRSEDRMVGPGEIESILSNLGNLTKSNIIGGGKVR